MTLTFVDSGVLIAAARGTGIMQQRAMAVLGDPNRQFASSAFVRLEVLPKPLHFHHTGEVLFYETFFRAVAVWAPINSTLLNSAFRIAASFGLAAIDALHVAAANQVGATELITTERPTKPIHRVKDIQVVTIHTAESN